MSTKLLKLEKTREQSVLKLVKDLQTQRPVRDRQQLFYVEGVRNFVQVVNQNFEIETVVYSDKLCTSSVTRKLVRQLKNQGVPILNVKPEKFRAVSSTEQASGVGAIVRQRWTALESISTNTDCCWVVLEEINSAGNLGTLIRSSEALGATGFIVLGKTLELHAPGTIRATMGAFFKQDFVRSSLQAFQTWVKTREVLVVGASPDGTRDFDDFYYPKATFLFLGEEKHGLTDQQRTLCAQLLRIPMCGSSDSLNLGVAGSLMLYEISRSKKRLRV
jgi:RNA methyltransferase, TrmH family